LGIGLGIGISKLLIGILLELGGHTLLLLHPGCLGVLGASIRQHLSFTPHDVRISWRSARPGAP
jgi:hypothetical protein